MSNPGDGGRRDGQLWDLSDMIAMIDAEERDLYKKTALDPTTKFVAS